MSAEKTAEMFKNQSEEEIINWMVRNMTPEQLKQCFDVPIAPDDELDIKKDVKPNINDIRRYCQNKRYVIHKIENDNVYFWYYLVKSGRWQYSIEPLSNFPKSMGAKADECGDDTNIEKNFSAQLKTAYNENDLYAGKKFANNNVDESETEVFNQVKTEYKNLNINNDWLELEEISNTLLIAISIQRSVSVSSNLKQIFDYAPILIEATTDTKVYYYYLKQKDGEVKFVYDNIEINNFKEDLVEIIDELNLDIYQPDQPSSSNAKQVDEWKKLIREAANDIDSDDLKTIKQNYSEMPLSDNSRFFMKGLFDINEFGKTSNNIDLSQYILNKYGKHTANLFKPTVIRNNFGTQTIALTSK